MVLTTTQTGEIRAALLADRAQVLADLAGLDAEIDALSKEQNQGGMATVTALAGDTTDLVEQERDLALVQGLRQRLADIDGALGRLDAGIYGRCQGCGQIIAPERLEALPFATLCIACKGRDERRRATLGR